MGVKPKIVDERCTCGTLKSAHSVLVINGIPVESASGPGPDAKGPPNGTRGVPGDCRRFTWAAFVLDDGTDLSNEVIPW